MDGKKVKKRAHSLDPLTTPLHLFGWSVLRKLILRFVLPCSHPYYYPYGTHNIVLEQDPYGYFRVQFYHYYNVKNERIDIPIEQQYYDMCALDHFLFENHVLYYTFHGRIIRPPFFCFTPVKATVATTATTPYGVLT